MSTLKTVTRDAFELALAKVVVTGSRIDGFTPHWRDTGEAICSPQPTFKQAKVEAITAALIPVCVEYNAPTHVAETVAWLGDGSKTDTFNYLRAC